MTQLPENKRIERKFRQLDRLARQQATVIACINSFMEILMAGQQELNDKIAELKQAVADDQASDQAVVDTLDGIIAQLKADGDTTAAIASLEEVKTSISTVSSPNNS